MLLVRQLFKRLPVALLSRVDVSRLPTLEVIPLVTVDVMLLVTLLVTLLVKPELRPFFFSLTAPMSKSANAADAIIKRE